MFISRNWFFCKTAQTVSGSTNTISEHHCSRVAPDSQWNLDLRFWVDKQRLDRWQMKDFLVKVAIKLKDGRWRGVSSTRSAWSHIFCVFDLSESEGTSSRHGLGQGQQLTAVYNNTGQVEVLNAAFQESVSTVWSSETPLPQFPLSSSVSSSPTQPCHVVSQSKDLSFLETVA